MAKTTESMILQAVLLWLTIMAKTKPLYFFRSGSGALKTEQGRFFKTGRAGCPDITCLYAGRFIGLEIKTATGRQSPAQRAAESEILAAGGEYYIIRSVADVREVVG